MKRTSVLFAVPIITLLALSAAAQVPSMINYQGRLTDGAGQPLDTTVSITFLLYDEPGGFPIWSETHPAVTTTNGTFNVLLGSIEPIEYLFSGGTSRYLGITVGDDPELSPRTRLVSTPYAFRVSSVDGASGGRINGSVGINTYESSGTLHLKDDPYVNLYMYPPGDYYWLLSGQRGAFSISQGSPSSGWTRFYIDTSGNTHLALTGKYTEVGQTNLSNSNAMLRVGSSQTDEVLYLQGPHGDSAALITIWSGNTECAWIKVVNDSLEGASIRFHTADPSGTAVDERMRITTTGRVGIGTTSPEGALDVSSTTGGFIVPRMTMPERDELTGVNGMIIYNTTTNQFNFYENGTWVTK
jgi:hypothetical protein